MADDFLGITGAGISAASGPLTREDLERTFQQVRDRPSERYASTEHLHYCPPGPALYAARARGRFRCSCGLTVIVPASERS